MKKRVSTSILTAACLSTAMLAPAAAYAAKGDWLVRGRIINVSPNDKTGLVSGIAGTSATVKSGSTLELDFTYMLSDSVGVELILGTSKHKVRGATGAVAGADVGSVRTLPPTLTFQYHFAPQAKVRPYAGVGINYTLFFNEKAGAGLGAGASVKYKSSFGLAAQVGVDMDINKKWFMNLDLKYIDMNTKLTIGNSAVAGVTKVTLNPWVFGIGIGTRF